MTQLEIYLPILILIVLFEFILSGTWQPFYFRLGLPIFQRSMKSVSPPSLSPEALTERFQGGGLVAPLLFKRISPHEVAFREGFSFALLSYTPLMHGMIEHRDGKLRVIGRSLLSPLLFCLVLIFMDLPSGNGWAKSGPLPFAILIFFLLYVIQALRFNKVFKVFVAESKSIRESSDQG